jgi:hypothetical protein
MKYTLIFLLLSTFCLSSYADSEEDERRRILEEYSVKESAQPPSKNNAIGDDALEDSIKKTVQDLQVVSDRNNSNDTSSVKPKELKESFVTGVMDDMMKNLLREFLKENPFSKMSEGEVRSLIEGRLNAVPGGNFFHKNPSTLDFIVKWLRDKRALPKLLSIVNKAERVKIYGIIVFCILILSFLLNLFNSKGNIFKRILKKLMIVVGVTLVNFTAFYIMFRPNVQPTVDLLIQHLRS